MNVAVAVKEPRLADQADARLAEDVKRLLRGDVRINLAPHMYTGDSDGSRHTNGHSSPAYYVISDEDATFEIAMREIASRYENFMDMGVGGDEAVLRRGLVATRTVGAKNYLAFDCAPALARRAAELADERGLYGEAFVCDIFNRLPIAMPNSLVGVLGLTNPREIEACYGNTEMAELIRSCPSRVADTDKMDYHLMIEKTSLDVRQEVCFVALGLRARVAHTVDVAGEVIAIQADQFFPVLNTDRFSVGFNADALERAGWNPAARWSSSGRVHYQHAQLG
jgi:hypothetical protein